MLLLITISEAQKKLAENTRQKRLQQGFTQKVLAERSGVALSTLRLFERTGMISLESFLKLQMFLGGLDGILKETQVKEIEFLSIDDVLKSSKAKIRQRGKRT